MDSLLSSSTIGYQCRLFIHRYELHEPCETFGGLPSQLNAFQVIFLAVRFYFVICLFGRQFIVTGKNPSGVSTYAFYSLLQLLQVIAFIADFQIDLWLPITTMIQFIVYMGWMKVLYFRVNFVYCFRHNILALLWYIAKISHSMKWLSAVLGLRILAFVFVLNFSPCKEIKFF